MVKIKNLTLIILPYLLSLLIIDLLNLLLKVNPIQLRILKGWAFTLFTTEGTITILDWAFLFILGAMVMVLSLWGGRVRGKGMTREGPSLLLLTALLILSIHLSLLTVAAPSWTGWALGSWLAFLLFSVTFHLHPLRGRERMVWGLRLPLALSSLYALLSLASLSGLLLAEGAPPPLLQASSLDLTLSSWSYPLIPALLSALILTIIACVVQPLRKGLLHLYEGPLGSRRGPSDKKEMMSVNEVGSWGEVRRSHLDMKWSLALLACLALAACLTLLAPLGSPHPLMGIDAPLYYKWLTLSLEEEGYLFLLKSDRPLVLLLLAAWASFDQQLVRWGLEASLPFLSAFSVLSASILGWALWGTRLVPWVSYFSATSPYLLASLYGGFYARLWANSWLMILLSSIILVQKGRKGASFLLVASYFILLFSHTYTWLLAIAMVASLLLWDRLGGSFLSSRIGPLLSDLLMAGGTIEAARALLLGYGLPLKVGGFLSPYTAIVEQLQPLKLGLLDLVFLSLGGAFAQAWPLLLSMVGVLTLAKARRSLGEKLLSLWLLLPLLAVPFLATVQFISILMALPLHLMAGMGAWKLLEWFKMKLRGLHPLEARLLSPLLLMAFLLPTLNSSLRFVLSLSS